MPKHKPEELTLGEIINYMSDQDAAEWWRVMGVDVPGIEEAIESAEYEEALTDHRGDEIEANYLEDHVTDRYRVSWPDHVITPKFNADASYQPA